MEAIVKWAVEHAPELVLGLLFMLGLPVLVKVLRRDSHKKLTDKDPSNDWIGHLEGDVADVVERKIADKDKIISKK